MCKDPKWVHRQKQSDDSESDASPGERTPAPHAVSIPNSDMADFFGSRERTRRRPMAMERGRPEEEEVEEDELRSAMEDRLKARFGLPKGESPETSEDDSSSGDQPAAPKKREVNFTRGFRPSFKSIAEGKARAPAQKRNPTTYSVVSKPGRQGPHTIPFVASTLLGHAMEENDFDPALLAGTRMAPSPRAAEKNMRKFLEAEKGVDVSERQALSAKYAKTYSKQHGKFMTVKTTAERREEFLKLQDLLPDQTQAIAQEASRAQLGGKGERQKNVAGNMLSGDRTHLDLSGASGVLSRKVMKREIQMEKLAQTEDGAQLELSQDTQESSLDEHLSEDDFLK